MTGQGTEIKHEWGLFMKMNEWARWFVELLLVANHACSIQAAHGRLSMDAGA